MTDVSMEVMDDEEGSQSAMDESFHNANEDEESPQLDCYPYTLSPLLLFAPSDYFDKGYSNYNSVAKFFEPMVPVGRIELINSLEE